MMIRRLTAGVGVFILLFGVLSATAAPVGADKGNKGKSGDDVPGHECDNGQHSGNPHCEPDVTVTVTPTASPTAEPTVSPTASPTVEPTAQPTVTPTVTPTETPTEEPTPTDDPTPSPTPTPGSAVETVVLLPPVVAMPEPQPVFTFGTLAPQPVEDFDVSQITALPHAGDGSSEEAADAEQRSVMDSLMFGIARGLLFGLIIIGLWEGAFALTRGFRR